MTTEPVTTYAEDGDTVTLTREFDAPRERVFAAYVHPDEFAVFFAPEGLHVPRDSVAIDAHPGGRFACTMVMDDGSAEFPVEGRFLEVVAPERIAFVEPDSGMEQELTLADLGGGRCRLTVRQTHVPEEYRGPDAHAGFDSSFRRLARHLAAHRG